MKKEIFECPNCNREWSMDEMDKEAKKLLCPYCGAIIITGYKGE